MSHRLVVAAFSAALASAVHGAGRLLLDVLHARPGPLRHNSSVVLGTDCRGRSSDRPGRNALEGVPYRAANSAIVECFGV